ncbi:hypothetical protein [Tessaracoccus coleopterorum]|uniref:hypothetical protein n=1 Tax=Tessaracoccus coleopterorum TaxID=2714950 RepID=UPI0018D48FA1|nr:hypothetical protein [Tessaracoccus coleopterorum]
MHQVAAKLRREAVASGSDGAISVDGTRIATYAELIDFVSERVQNDATKADWAGAATTAGSVNAFIRRLRSSQKALGPIIRGNLTGDTTRRTVSTGNSRVTVVDLHNLPERAQRFVVGVVLRSETEAKERAGAGGCCSRCWTS